MIAILLQSEIRAVKAWFAQKTFSKLIVMAGFLVIVGLVVAALFKGTGYYFSILAGSQNFGYQTAIYIIRASVLIVIWLGIGSSIASTAGLLLSPSKNLSWLVTLPTNISRLLVWQNIKTVILNTIFLSFLLTPVLLAFELSFSGGISYATWARVLVGLFILAMTTHSLGNLFAYWAVSLLHRRSYLLWTLGTIVFVIILFALFATVFPSGLEKLAWADPGQFDSFYSSLPLSANWVPSNWFAANFTGGSTNFALLSHAVSIFLLGTSMWYQTNNFLKVFQRIQAGSALGLYSVSQTRFSGGWLSFTRTSPFWALIKKDLLGLLRSPQDMGYSAFLLCLLVFFFGLFSRVHVQPDTPQIWINLLRAFSFVGLIFFTNTYLLRSVFPSMAREGQSAWYLFTQAITRHQIWRSKIFFGLILSSPFILLGFFIWILPGFSRSNAIIFLVLSAIAIVTTTLVQVFLGMINPNFSESTSSERISTSGMGLVTVFLTLAYTALVGFGINLILTAQITFAAMALLLLIGSTVLLLLLSWFSQKALKSYQF